MHFRSYVIRFGGEKILISLIIVAFDRKQFIKEAILSAVRQKVSQEILEVIVIKNFEDAEIDEYINALGYKNIVSQSISLGKKLSEAISVCSGEVVAFLEDDDIMADYRISDIFSAFSDADVVFFKNSVLPFIDSNALDLESVMKRNDYKRVEIITEEDRDIRDLIHRDSEFNLSSMAVRKYIFNDSLNKLATFNYKVDNFIFYQALCTGGKIAITEKKLTYYRLHPSASHVITDSPNYLSERIKMYQNLADESERLTLAFADTSLRGYLECRQLEQFVIINVLTNRERNETLSFLARCIACSIKIRRRFLTLMLILNLFGIFSPGIAIYLYIAFEKRKKKRIRLYENRQS